ncbi:hypothetical protein [Microbacterium sp. RURRCA19A]|uniref:hypothetical protein n=1 Tax=Microbacterium sp. RURRCA19A TaxID=1907391 RepID=UPI0009556AC1|nr:hypothetical protein [Microbacterium sp. RURRCA19A]SIS17800.1 hypothetical protein SAMN05880568_3294 [Microbacterium sp. RURRCA19A]
MTAATIPSAQLQAITRLELASDALDKALRAVQHPDLEFGGSALIAPSGLKHLGAIRQTLHALESAIRSAGFATPETKMAPLPVPAADVEANTVRSSLSPLGRRVADSVDLGLATDLHEALAAARQQLNLVPEMQADPELRARVLDSALREGSRLGRRIYHALQDDPRSHPSTH